MTTHHERDLGGGRGDPLGRHDATEPTHREPEPSAPPSTWQQRVPGPQIPGLVGGVTLILGIWLMLAPLMWSYGDAATGFDARWNDALAGLVIAATGLARLTRPIRLMPVTVLSFLLGVWLVIAPFVLAYGFGEDSTRAAISDIVVGLIVAALAVLGYVNGRVTALTRG